MKCSAAFREALALIVTVLSGIAFAQDKPDVSLVPSGATWKKDDVLRTSANVERVQFSPDGRLAFLAAHQGVSVWDWKSGKEIHYLAFPKDSKLGCLAVSAEGKRLATAHLDRTRVLVWDVKSGDVLGQFNHGAPIHALTFSADGKQLLSGGGHPPGEKALPDHYVQLWNVADVKAIKRFHGPERPIRSLVLAADSLIAEDQRGDVFVWSRITGDIDRKLTTHTFTQPPRWLKDGRVLVGYETGAGRYLTRWNAALDKKEQLIDMSPTNQPVSGFDVSADGSLVVTAHPGELIVWNVKAKERLCTLTIPREGVHELAITPDGHEVVAAFANKTVARMAVENKRR